MSDAPTISAKQVKELRDQTGAGMMECKNALDRDRAATSTPPSSCCASGSATRR